MRVLEGSLPPRLRGVYFKNGPAYRVQTHPFDGAGYVAKIRFDGSHATYYGRRIGEIGNAFNGFAFIPPANTQNTHVVQVDKNVLAALYDGGVPALISADDLCPIVASNHHAIPLRRRLNSHPKPMQDGYVFASFDYGFTGTTVRFWKRNIEYTNIPVPGITYFHDFAATSSCLAFFHHALQIDLSKVFTHGAAGCLTQKDDPTRLCIITDKDRRIWHTLDASLPMFVSHVANAKETNGTMEIDAICYASYLDVSQGARLMRFTAPLKHDGIVRVEQLCDDWCEFPTRIGDDHVLMCCSAKGAHPLRSIAEWRDGEFRVVFRRPAWVVTEPVVCCANQYAVTIAFDLDECITKLVILAAPTWEVQCVLEVSPSFVPLGLHGTFVEEA